MTSAPMISVELTSDELLALSSAARLKRRELTRQVRAAHKRRAAGERVQHGVLAAHERDLAWLTAADAKLDRAIADKASRIAELLKGDG